MLQCPSANQNPSGAFDTSSAASSGYAIASQEVCEYAKINYYNDICAQNLAKSIAIFPGYEYIISFYDYDQEKMVTLVGLVETITNGSNPYLTFKYVINMGDPVCDKCGLCHNRSSGNRPVFVDGMPTCGCILAPVNPVAYPETIRKNIYLNTISNIEYKRTPGNPGKPVKPVEEKERFKVVLLGITATTAKAIIINLKMLHDNQNNAVTEVNLQTGGVYHFVYTKGRTVYELDGKLVQIRETEHSNVPIDTVVRTPEQVGLNNSVYSSYGDEEVTDKDIFLKSGNITQDVILTVHSDDDEDIYLDSIYLSSLRDCYEIKEEDIDDGFDTPEEIPQPGGVTVDPNDCKFTCFEKRIDKYKINLNDETITYNQGEQVSIEEVLKYYFGE